MMDYRATMSFMHPNKDYMCEDTYESLVWNETEPKPTDKESFPPRPPPISKSP